MKSKKSFALSVCLVVCGAVGAANLVPTDFANDNAGGVCGWDARGAPFERLGSVGPRGKNAIRISGTSYPLRFEMRGIRLAAGGRYRLSADVRTKGLAALKRVDLLVYTASWSRDESVSIPRDTAGEWKRIARDFTMPDSRDGQYALALYASEAFADGAFLDVSGVMLEPLDAKAEKGSIPVGPVVPFKPRISPVDPLLSDVDADHARLTFFYPGDLEAGGERVVLQAKMLGRAATGVFGTDHKAVVDFGKIDKGCRRIDLKVAGEKSGKVYAENGYTIKAAEAVKGATSARRLNNFVSELLAKPLENGETSFAIAKPQWVYISLDRPHPGVSVDIDDMESALRFRAGEPSETQRLLPAGWHAVRVKGVNASSRGGTLRVRLVKTIGGASLKLAADANSDYPQWGYSRGYYDRLGLYSTLNTAELTGYGYPKVMRVAALASDRGIKTRFAGGPDSAHPSRNGIATLYEAVAANPAFGHGVAMAIDENAISAPPHMKYNYAEAAWLLGEKCHDLSIWYADGFYELFNRPFLDIPELSAAVNSGDGNGLVFTEAYYVAPNTEDEWQRLVRWIKLQRRQLRAALPAAPSRFIYALSGWEFPGIWTTRHRPHVDLKAFYSRLLRLFATDPDFVDIGGVSFTSPICDEDLARFYYAAVRHYCLEGRTDDFAENLGYAMLTAYIRNGDFDHGLDGWTVFAAEPGSVDVGHMTGFGRKSQMRVVKRGELTAGDHFAVMTRSTKAPNVLRQKIEGLKPGTLYQISFCSMYYDDMLKPGAVQKESAGVHVAVAGAEQLEDLDHVVRLRGKRNADLSRAALYVHRVVFRATGETAALALSDWPGATIGDEAAGERTAFNYVGCTPFYVRSPEDVRALSEINLATGRGLHP